MIFHARAAGIRRCRPRARRARVSSLTRNGCKPACSRRPPKKKLRSPCKGTRPLCVCQPFGNPKFGEAFDCLYLTRRAGIVAAQEEAELEARLIGWLLDHGGKPGSGIWETRGRARHYTLSLRGDEDEAIAQFERVLAVANDVGLLAEEYDVRNGRLAGNFPQALSHLAVVKTAMLLSGSAQGHRRAR